MKNHSFTVIATGVDTLGDRFADCFFEAGCDDATVAIQKGFFVVEFDREARTFTHALVTAMRDVARAGATPERVEPDDLVSAADIAKRGDIGRAAVSLYAKGNRGQDFPRPVARVTSESPLYDWAEVAAWLHRKGRLPLVEVVRARTVREVNRYIMQEQPDQSFLARQLRTGRTWILDLSMAA